MFEDILNKAADAVKVAAEAVGKGAEAVGRGAEAIKKAKKDSMTISEDSPLLVSGLEVYPNKLKYKNIRCNFNDIEHLGWYWESKTINGILNTQSVEMTIYIRNSKNISIKKSTMYLTPKLVTAYNYIAKETFDTRLKFYTDQLEKTGSFIYTTSGFWGDSHTTFYSNGTVKSGDKSFELSKAYIEAFELNIKQGGMFSSSLNVKLLVDKDIILTLINFILENPQEPSEYIQNYKRQKKSKKTANLFLTNVVSLMAKLAYADGIISSEEVDVVKEFLTNTMKIDTQELSQMMIIFNQAKNSPKPFEYFANSLLNNHHENVLYAVLDVLFLIAIADGIISAEEELLLLEAEAIFGIKGSMYTKFKNQVHEQHSNKKEYYMNILGLSYNSTQGEIKKTYRRLAMKFHPDKVSHLGEEFMHEAEIKMKEINEAYEYLKNN